jgi:hypothetical protein
MSSISFRDSLNVTIIQSTDPDKYIYANINKPVVGSYVSPDTAEFSASWAVAPDFLPPTSVDNFTFFVNGQNIEKASIDSFTQASGSSVLVVDSGSLGFTFESNDTFLAVGKFN